MLELQTSPAELKIAWATRLSLGGMYQRGHDYDEPEPGSMKTNFYCAREAIMLLKRCQATHAFASML